MASSKHYEFQILLRGKERIAVFWEYWADQFKLEYRVDVKHDPFGFSVVRTTDDQVLFEMKDALVVFELC